MDGMSDEGDGFARETELGAVVFGEDGRGQRGRNVPFYAISENVRVDLHVELKSSVSEGKFISG